MGPLLYHFADAYGTEDVSIFVELPFFFFSYHGQSEQYSVYGVDIFSQEMSIELSLEDVKKVAFHYGFELEVSLFIYLFFLPLSWTNTCMHG